MTGSGVVVVTGATGRQGRAVSQALLAAGWPVRAMTRYPRSHAAGALAAAGAQLAVADMEDPASLDRAFAGAYGVYSVPTFMTSGLDGEVRPGRNVGDAAHRAGIRHLVQASAGTGARGTGAGSALPATAPMPAAGRTHHRPSRPVTAPGSHVVGRAQTLDVSRTGARPAHAAASTEGARS